ncbi:hypothetical protein BCR35DRAFT_329177 [Leucosporidium creatinivorum]|uniref:Uncharacterized protein n=1 Tax=Leucosporidium creatinivorum TaxID=106004 RepID=A0A1Y2G460_9BASI|nr:hypothetical protein BCR35DRAFT_329177 [Leucosporidium creatinivorum]
MGQTISAPSTPHLPSSLKSKGKGKGKARRHTTQPYAPPPLDSNTIVFEHSADQQQLIARYLAEEKLEGRTPRVVIRDTAASPQWGKVQDDEEEHLEGLRINVGGRRLDKSRSAFTGLQISSDSHGSEELLHEACKKHERSRSASSQPLSRSRSAAPPSSAHTWHPSSSRRRGSASSEHGYLNFRPPSPSPIPIGRSSHASPTSHWSESSAGGRTPPPNFNTFRNSVNFSVNSKRFSTHSSNPRHSAHEATHSLANDLMAPTKPLQKAIEKGLQGYRANKENERRRKAMKKRGPIVVVGAQRVGSGRYSMMKEAAARSAAARKESIGSKEGLASRRGSKDSNGRRRSSASEGKRVSASRRGSEPTRSQDGGLSPPTNLSASAPSPSFLHRRSPSAQALMSFIAASPDLTCPDPSHPLFDTQATPRPSIARLPEGHPANHHARFRSYNERVAALPPNPVVPAAFSTGPAPLPPRGVLAQRRASALAGSTRSSIVSAYGHMEPQDGFEGARRSSSFSGASSRKLSNYRLSIAEPRDEEEVAESRRSSIASWTTTTRSRSRMGSVDQANSNDATSSKGSVGGAGMGRRQSSASLGALNDHRRPSTTSMPFVNDAPVLPTARSNSVVSRTSFPHSVAYTSDSRSTPYRDARLGSTVSYFSMPTTTLDLPLTPEATLTPLADVNRTPKPPATSAGEISWGGYSLAPPLPMDASSRGSVTSVASYSEIAPETVDAFPAPPTTARPLRLNVPTPLVIKKHHPFPYDSEGSLLSDASTPSTGSFDSSSSTSASSQGVLQLQQEEAFGSGNGYAQTLEMLSNAVQISLEGQGSTYKAPPSPSFSLGGHSAATFTMDDLMQLGGNSWSSAEAVRTSSLPPSYQPAAVASFPVVSSSPLLPSAPSTPKPKALSRRPSEHQLERASPNLSLPTQPLPATTSMRQAPPVFSDWKLRVSNTAPLRLPTVVSPMTDPFTTGYYEEEDLEVEDAAPSFVRIVSTTRSGAKTSFLDCSPTPPNELADESPVVEKPKGLGLDDGRPFTTVKTDAKRRFSFTPRELAITSARRDTHPTWSPPSMRKGSGLDALVEKKKSRSASEDNGAVLRLGSLGKRGFSKSEVSDWLATASRETVPVTRKL